MSTVPMPGTPAPANNAKTLLLQSDENQYVRPTAGGNAGVAPAASGSGYVISMAGNAPDGAGPNMGHGATQIVAQPDATGHPSSETGGGTVGDSGPGLGQ